MSAFFSFVCFVQYAPDGAAVDQRVIVGIGGCRYGWDGAVGAARGEGSRPHTGAYRRWRTSGRGVPRVSSQTSLTSWLIPIFTAVSTPSLVEVFVAVFLSLAHGFAMPSIVGVQYFWTEDREVARQMIGSDRVSTFCERVAPISPER